MSLQYSAAALNDLDDIWFYIAERNLSAADRLISDLRARARQLSETTWMGHSRDDIGDPNVRCWTEGSYVIAYVGETPHVIIVRVVHGARDFTQLDFGSR